MHPLWLAYCQDVVREVFSHLDRHEVGYVNREQVSKKRLKKEILKAILVVM